MKKNLFLTSFAALVMTTNIVNAATDVTFAGKYTATTGVKNVSSGTPGAYDFSYTGKDANGNDTAEIASNTTSGVNQSNFAYTLADGSTTETLADNHSYSAADYTANTVAGTTSYENVSVASGYILNAENVVTASSYSYINPQGGTEVLVLDSGNNPVVASLTKQFNYSADSQNFTGASPITVDNTSTTLDGSAYVLLTDSVGNTYTLSSDGSSILMNGVTYTGTPAGDLADQFAAAQTAYAADAALFENMVTDLALEQSGLEANALQAKNAFVADTNTQGDLVDRYDTYTKAVNAYDAANNTYETTLGNFNADTTSYAAANDLYNSSIEEQLNNVKAYADNLVSGISTEGIAENTNAIATLNADADTDGSVAHAIAVEAQRVDNAIGDLSTLDTSHNLVEGSVADNLTSLDNAIVSEENARIAGDELTLASARDYADTQDALMLDAAKAYFDSNAALSLNQSKAYTDSRIHKLDKELSAGVAGAVALSSVAVANVKKGEVSVGGGYGYYNGESAMAFGAAMGLSEGWSINAGAGIADSNVSFRAGANYKFKLF